MANFAMTPDSSTDGGVSLEMVLAKAANDAIAQGRDPKGVSDLLTAHIRYARQNPQLRQQAEAALREGRDPMGVATVFAQQVAADPMAKIHEAYQAGTLQRDIARKNAADVAEARAAGEGDTYASRLGSMMERGLGTVVGNAPATALTYGISRLPGHQPLSRAEAAAQVAGEVEEAGQNAPGVNLPFGLGRVTLADLPAAMAGYKAAGSLLGTKDMRVIGAVMEGGKRLIAPEEESVGSRALGTVGHAVAGASVPMALQGAGRIVQNIGQRTGATDMLGKLASAIGLDRVAENIGTKGAVNELLRARQTLMDKLGVTGETADQYLDAMVKRGQAVTAPAYAAAEQRAGQVEAAPARAAQKLSDLWESTKVKLLPAPAVEAPSTGQYQGPLHGSIGYEGSDLLDDVMHRMEAQRQSPVAALSDAISDAKGRYGLRDIQRAMTALNIPSEGTPFATAPSASTSIPEFPKQPISQTHAPGEAGFVPDARRVEMRAANDLSVRRAPMAEASAPPKPSAPNIVAQVQQAQNEAFAHPTVQRYLAGVYRDAPNLRGQVGYDVADQIKRDMNADWGKLKPADRAGEYGASLREAKGLVQDYLDALSEGKASEANALHRAEVAVPKEFFERGFGVQAAPSAKGLLTRSPTAIVNEIAKLPEGLQATAAEAARAGAAANVAQNIRGVGLPASVHELLHSGAIDLPKIRQAFKTDAEFNQFVAKLAEMRQTAAAQAQRMGPQQTGLRTFWKPQNPLATPRGEAARTNAEGQPFARIAPPLPLSSLWNNAILAGSAASDRP
jgi:hypothetical protein